MSYCVYVLWSVQAQRTYVGQSEDSENRLNRHNAGLVRSTKAYRPWTKILVEEYATRAEAMKRESWLKSSSGRKWMREFIEKKKETGLSVALQTPRDRDHAERDRTKPA
jgi:putative endonuclease